MKSFIIAVRWNDVTVRAEANFWCACTARALLRYMLGEFQHEHATQERTHGTCLGEFWVCMYRKSLVAVHDGVVQHDPGTQEQSNGRLLISK